MILTHGSPSLGLGRDQGSRPALGVAWLDLIFWLSDCESRKENPEKSLYQMTDQPLVSELGISTEGQTSWT